MYNFNRNSGYEGVTPLRLARLYLNRLIWDPRTKNFQFELINL